MKLVINKKINMPAKKKVKNGLLGALGAAVLGLVAGATAMFLSEKDNREKVKRTVDVAVKKSKMEVSKAKKNLASTGKKVMAAKKKLLKK